MAEYIDKQKLIDILEARADMAIPDYKPVLLNIAKFVQLLPAAEVESVRHTTFKDGECMACGWLGDCVDTPHYNYCPGCGARADGGTDNG